MSHLRAHQSGPAWKKSPTTTSRVIKRMIRRYVCVGSGLSSYFLSARPPPRNLVIHPRALSVNKCRRLGPPVWWKAVCGGAAQQGAHRAPLTLCNSRTSDPTNQRTSWRTRHHSLSCLSGGCLLLGFAALFLALNMWKLHKKNHTFLINLTLIISPSLHNLPST